MAQAASEMNDEHGRPGSANSADEETAELREGIERTREEMGRTIDALQEKLSPEHVKEHVREAVHEATVGRAEHIAHAASEKLGEAREKISEAAAPAAQAAAQAARAKSAAAARYARGNPVPAGALAVAVVLGVLALLWSLLARDDEDEIRRG